MLVWIHLDARQRSCLYADGYPAHQLILLVEPLKNFAPASQEPLGRLREVSVILDFRQHRVVRRNAGRLQERIVLKAFRKDLPPDRVNRPIWPRIDHEWVTVGPAGPG